MSSYSLAFIVNQNSYCRKRLTYGNTRSAMPCQSLIVSTAGERFAVTPSNQEPVEGNRLSVSCSSNGGIAILWYKEGMVIPSNSPLFVLPSTNFDSSSTLTIESVNHTLHSGRYACVAVFDDSSQASAPFNITVRCENLLYIMLWGVYNISFLRYWSKCWNSTGFGPRLLHWLYSSFWLLATAGMLPTSRLP